MAATPLESTTALPALPDDWRRLCKDQISAPYFHELAAFVAEQRRQEQVFPPQREVFRAFELTPLDSVKVVLLGQDPYHGEGQAHGLCFSVAPGVKPPPSLKNIFRELEDDLGIAPPDHGNLNAWAEQGVLLLNTVLTVRASEANSHRGQGWEAFTDAVLSKLSDRDQPLVFVLWGKPAQKKSVLIDQSRHAILESAHPSPLSAHRGFLGGKPFSAINDALERFGLQPIDWSL